MTRRRVAGLPCRRCGAVMADVVAYDGAAARRIELICAALEVRAWRDGLRLRLSDDDPLSGAVLRIVETLQIGVRAGAADA